MKFTEEIEALYSFNLFIEFSTIDKFSTLSVAIYRSAGLTALTAESYK